MQEIAEEEANSEAEETPGEVSEEISGAEVIAVEEDKAELTLAAPNAITAEEQVISQVTVHLRDSRRTRPIRLKSLTRGRRKVNLLMEIGDRGQRTRRQLPHL